MDLEAEKGKPVRTDREIIEEILEIVRERGVTIGQSLPISSYGQIHGLEIPVDIGAASTGLFQYIPSTNIFPTGKLLSKDVFVLNETGGLSKKNKVSVEFSEAKNTEKTNDESSKKKINK